METIVFSYVTLLGIAQLEISFKDFLDVNKKLTSKQYSYIIVVFYNSLNSFLKVGIFFTNYFDHFISDIIRMCVSFIIIFILTQGFSPPLTF